jgi:hypothetical protein
MSATSKADFERAPPSAANGDLRELTVDDLDAVTGAVKRSLPNGRTDVIKAMGNTKWGDIELGR